MQAFLKGGSIKPKDKESQQKQLETSTSSVKDKKQRRPQPWVEKYRPRCVDDVAYQEEVVAVLKKSLKGSDLPNLLFYGPPGTGKTSTILAAARELFGDMMRDRVLELNASDERGISVIRDKVKTFAQLSASSLRPDGKPCPPFKIVILDEADSMTGAAQAALRRTMERESKTTRFCLICNYVSRIIEPITSRCAKFRFKPLADDILRQRVKGICAEESVQCDDEAISALLAASEGDMRKAITTLQSTARLKGDEAITKQDVIEVAGVIGDDVIENLLKVCRSGSYEKIDKTVVDVMAEGHSAGQIILQLHDMIIPSPTFTDQQKSVVCERLAVIVSADQLLHQVWNNTEKKLVIDKRLIDGADEYIQLMDLCTVIMQQIWKTA